MTTLSQVLAEARVLVTRLHDREKLADGAVAQSQSLNEKINCMKEVGLAFAILILPSYLPISRFSTRRTCTS